MMDRPVPRWLRWASLPVGVAVLGLVIAVSLGQRQLTRTYPLPAERLAVSDDSATVSRGRHLVRAVAQCGHCHGEDLAGQVLVDSKLLGRLAAPNLTGGRGGVGDRLDAAALEAVVRHGVLRSGRSAIAMPAQDYRILSDADMGAIVAYVERLPSVDRELPSTRLTLFSRLLIGLGKLPIVSAAAIPGQVAHRAAPPGDRVAYGGYLARVGGCHGCHGEDLTGGSIPGEPPESPAAANITPAGLAGWTSEDFVAALREGRKKGGGVLNQLMPWKFTAELSDAELDALWSYLRTVPGRGYPGN